MPDKNYYKILQIDPSAEPEVVQAAYRRLAQKYHPDTNVAPDAIRRMQELNEAYEVLSDPVKRAVFDRQYTNQDGQPAEDRRRAEYEHQQTARAAEQRQRQEAAQLSAGQRSRSNLRLTLTPGVTMDFVKVPAGTFIMGSNDREDKEKPQPSWLARTRRFGWRSNDREDKEKPQHTVGLLDDYWIGKYPVTNEQFAQFVTAAKYQVDRGNWKKIADHPVVRVTWRDAMAYCQWLNKTLRGELKDLELRLPTEAEWEKAARSTDGRVYPWGNEWDQSKCNTREGGKGDTTPVGAYSPQGDSPYGAADMVGNVLEWCHSLYKPYPYQAADGRESEADDGDRVLRGGSWYRGQVRARCASRSSRDPDYRFDNGGFRCCCFSPGSRF